MLRKKKTPPVKKREAIISKNTPFAFIESFKSLRANIEFTTFDGELKVIVFSSSIPNEGKSSVVINTAKTLAESGHKVLLIDGDLRSPSIGRYLRVRRDVTIGLSTILAGKSQLSDAIYSYAPANIDVMLSGPIPPNPAELISHKKTEILIETLKKDYDYILIDTPPVGVVSDAALMSRYADGAIFVVRHNYADRDLVKDSLRKLEASNVNILGAVLNDYDVSKDVNASEGYEYQYHYNPDNYQNG